MCGVVEAKQQAAFQQTGKRSDIAQLEYCLLLHFQFRCPCWQDFEVFRARSESTGIKDSKSLGDLGSGLEIWKGGKYCA